MPGEGVLDGGRNRHLQAFGQIARGEAAGNRGFVSMVMFDPARRGDLRPELDCQTRAGAFGGAKEKGLARGMRASSCKTMGPRHP